MSRKLTSSTVRGMHILYSFSNIFPLCASLVCSHSVSKKKKQKKKQPSERSLRRPDGMCVIPGDVSAHVGGLVRPGYEMHPELRLTSFIGTSGLSSPAANVRAEMSSLRDRPPL